MIEPDDAVTSTAGPTGEETAQLLGELAEARSFAEHLETALLTGRRIGMAIGILMCRRLVGEDEAWDLLRQTSQRRNTKVRNLAEEVILTGEL